MRDVRVGVERDVGECHAASDEPVAPAQVPLHGVECPVTGGAAALDAISVRLGLP